MSLKKGLFIFLLLTAAVSGFILYTSIDRNSFEIFKQADLRLIGTAMLLTALVWVLDALKLMELTRGAGCDMDFRFAIRLTWINYFGAALTPMQSGGGPFQMFLMYRHGISVGKTVAITLIRTIMTLLILGFSVPIAFFMEGGMPMDDKKFSALMIYVAALAVIGAVCFVLTLVRPDLVKRFFFMIIHALARFKIIKRGRASSVRRWIVREVEDYRVNMRGYLTAGRRHFITAVVLGVLQMLTHLSVMPIMILAMGHTVSWSQCVTMQAIFIFTLFFMPTPGGSGAAEVGAALVAGQFVPDNVAGIIGIGWRFITEYTGIMLGAVTALKMIGWSLANELSTHKHSEVI